MKILFDECVPLPLKTLLGGHDIKTAQEMNWGRLKNGELLRRAEKNGFDTFVTSDQNLSYQQNLADRHIALLVLSTNYWPDLRRYAARIEFALKSLQPGDYREVLIPSR